MFEQIAGMHKMVHKLLECKNLTHGSKQMQSLEGMCDELVDEKQNPISISINIQLTSQSMEFVLVINK